MSAEPMTLNSRIYYKCITSSLTPSSGCTISVRSSRRGESGQLGCLIASWPKHCFLPSMKCMMFQTLTNRSTERSSVCNCKHGEIKERWKETGAVRWNYQTEKRSLSLSLQPPSQWCLAHCEKGQAMTGPVYHVWIKKQIMTPQSPNLAQRPS